MDNPCNIDTDEQKWWKYENSELGMFLNSILQFRAVETIELGDKSSSELNYTFRNFSLYSFILIH